MYPNFDQPQCLCPNCTSLLRISKGVETAQRLTCPACGYVFLNPLHINAIKKSTFRGVMWVVAIIIVVCVIIANLTSDEEVAADLAKGHYITQDTYACTSQSAWDALGKYAVVGDTEAVQVLVSRGQIIPLYKGTEVYVDKAKFSYCIVRRKGSTQQLWVHIEHLKHQ